MFPRSGFRVQSNLELAFYRFENEATIERKEMRDFRSLKEVAVGQARPDVFGV